MTYDAGALPAALNEFIIPRFTQPTVPDFAFVEGTIRDGYTRSLTTSMSSTLLFGNC